MHGLARAGCRPARQRYAKFRPDGSGLVPERACDVGGWPVERTYLAGWPTCVSPAESN